MRENLRTWLALLALTLLGFLASHASARGLMLGLLAISGGKCAALGWRFMELRHANRAWSTALFGLLALLLGTAAWISAR